MALWPFIILPLGVPWLLAAVAIVRFWHPDTMATLWLGVAAGAGLVGTPAVLTFFGAKNRWGTRANLVIAPAWALLSVCGYACG